MKDGEQTQKGFSLIEIVVATGLILVIVGGALTAYNRFSGTVVLTNLAHDIGLSIREAQSYGLNVRSVGGNFNVSYGIHFENATRDSYFLYVDPDRALNRYIYSVATGGQIIETTSILRGYRIQDVCAETTAMVTKCFNGGGITYLDIAFDRPDPDAYFNSNISVDTYSRAEIIVSSPKGLTKTIEVLPTGYISVQ